MERLIVSTFIEYVHARPHDDEILFALAKALDFTADDVVANRRGVVTAKQQLKLLSKEMLLPLGLLAGTILFSLLIRLAWAGYVEHRNILQYLGAILAQLGTLHVGNFSDLYFRTGGESLPIIVRVFVIGSPLPVLKKVLRIDWRKVFAAVGGQVCTDIGVVNTKSEIPDTGGKKQDRIELDYFVVNDRKLRVNSAAMSAIAHGYQYRVYYLPATNTLLSIEPIPRL